MKLPYCILNFPFFQMKKVSGTLCVLSLSPSFKSSTVANSECLTDQPNQPCCKRKRGYKEENTKKKFYNVIFEIFYNQHFVNKWKTSVSPVYLTRKRRTCKKIWRRFSWKVSLFIMLSPTAYFVSILVFPWNICLLSIMCTPESLGLEEV